MCWGEIHIFWLTPKTPLPARDTPPSEKGAYRGEGRTTQHLPEVSPLASVICVKYKMTIAPNRGGRLKASKKADPPPTAPFHWAQGLPTAIRISHLGEGPLQPCLEHGNLERPPARERANSSPRPNPWRASQRQGPHPKRLPESSTARPSPTSGPPATAVATLPHPGIAPNSAWRPSPPPRPSGKLGFQASRVGVDGNAHRKMSGKHILPSIRQLRPLED